MLVFSCVHEQLSLDCIAPSSLSPKINETSVRRGRADVGISRPRASSRDGGIGNAAPAAASIIGGIGGGGLSNSSSAAKGNDLRVLVVRNISDRHTERSLCEGLFHEFKKHGEVKQVNVHEENGNRFAVVEFKKAQEAESAMETVQNRTFFGCEMKISLANCSVLPTLRNERGFRGRGRRYHAFGGFGGGSFEGFPDLPMTDSPEEEMSPGPVPSHPPNHRAAAGRLQVTVEQDVTGELEEEFDVNATRTLFVGNIDKAVTPNDLRSVFSRFGEILEVDMKSQRSGMYAFVQFNDMTSACRAKALMNAQLIGRSYCKVGFGHRVVTHTLWIGGISHHVSDADVARKCSRFGAVLEVAVNPAQKAALVHFDCKDSAVAAADELRGKIFHGSRLKVDFANRNSRSAFYKQLEEQGGDIGPMRGGPPDGMGMGGGGRGGPGPGPGPPGPGPGPPGPPGPPGHGDMFFGDMPPHGPPGGGRRGGFRPDFHRGFVGGRGGHGGRGNGPMFRNGPGGRGLFTRHFRGNMTNEDEDYDSELRNFGYMRERERQRQRVWQQGEDGDDGSDVPMNNQTDGSEARTRSPQSDMSDEDVLIPSKTAGSTEKNNQSSMSIKKEESSSSSKQRSTDNSSGSSSNNNSSSNGGAGGVSTSTSNSAATSGAAAATTSASSHSSSTSSKRSSESKKRSENKSSVEVSKSRSQETVIKEERHSPARSESQRDTGHADARESSSHTSNGTGLASSSSTSGGTIGSRQSALQSHGEASNSLQPSKRSERSESSRHHQAHRDKDNFSESSKSRRSTTDGNERRRRRDDNERSHESSQSSHSSSKPSSSSRQQAPRSRSRSPLSRSHGSTRRSRRSPGLSGEVSRSPRGSGKSSTHDDWSGRRDRDQYSPPQQQHRSSWRRHGDSSARPSGHGGQQRSPSYSPSSRQQSAKEHQHQHQQQQQQQQVITQQGQLVANDPGAVAGGATAVAAAGVNQATPMYTVSVAGAPGSFVVPQSSATFLYDANGQALAAAAVAAQNTAAVADSQRKQAAAAAAAGSAAPAGFVTTDMYVPAGAVQNQVVALSIPSSAVASQSTVISTALSATAVAGATQVPIASSAVAAAAGGQQMMAPGAAANTAAQPVQANALLGLLQRYPVMWQGHLALKNDAAAVQMHFLSGSQQLAQLALPQPTVSSAAATLRIAQRMRLDPSQLEGVALRMQAEMEHCLLLALPCGRDPLDVHAQTRALRTGFITYLQNKQAAGIINVAGNAPSAHQVANGVGAGFVLHIFPPCDFTELHVARVAPDLLSSAADSGHLMVVIAAM
ncbi:daf-12-interacting protein 1-like isoform X2 [Sycon ciliatum]|uniref:daf-12-interacting protein 1-like isoform X2 n=1 Tax=Sycon ciliatum TaxID=27933 RepID=UPI0031F68C18